MGLALVQFQKYWLLKNNENKWSQLLSIPEFWYLSELNSWKNPMSSVFLVTFLTKSKIERSAQCTLQINNLTRNLDGKPAESRLEFEILLTFLVQMTSANVCAGAARKLLRFLAKILFFYSRKFFNVKMHRIIEIYSSLCVKVCQNWLWKFWRCQAKLIRRIRAQSILVWPH